MRIAWTLGLCVVGGCFAERMTAPIDARPVDIETIEVIKGPASSLLYGTRNPNAAVVITTKRPRS